MESIPPIKNMIKKERKKKNNKNKKTPQNKNQNQIQEISLYNKNQSKRLLISNVNQSKQVTQLFAHLQQMMSGHHKNLEKYSDKLYRTSLVSRNYHPLSVLHVKSCKQK